MAELRLENISKSFGESAVIRGVDLTINSGEFTVFVGPSGCGKSTLLRLISGLESASGGTIYIDNKNVTNIDASQRSIAMVFQSYALYPHMNVYDNMAFGLKMQGAEKSLIEQRVKKAAQILELDELLARKPKALSGGQRQRVAIGRAIVREPKVFLFDEPLSNLDAELRVAMRLQIAKLHGELKTTMIYVTHDQTEAMTLANKIVVLRAGIIEQVGTPLELYNRPCNEFVAGFIGSPAMNFIAGEIVAVENNNAVIKIAELNNLQIKTKTTGGVVVGQKIKVGVRPEHFITFEQSQYNFTGKISFVENLGSITYCYLQLATSQLTVAYSGNKLLTANDEITIGIDANKILIFAEGGQCIN